jgi:hypothetical protein
MNGKELFELLLSRRVPEVDVGDIRSILFPNRSMTEDFIRTVMDGVNAELDTKIQIEHARYNQKSSFSAQVLFNVGLLKNEYLCLNSRRVEECLKKIIDESQVLKEYFQVTVGNVEWYTGSTKQLYVQISVGGGVSDKVMERVRARIEEIDAEAVELIGKHTIANLRDSVMREFEECRSTSVHMPYTSFSTSLTELGIDKNEWYCRNHYVQNRACAMIANALDESLCEQYHAYYRAKCQVSISLAMRLYIDVSVRLFLLKNI